MSDAKDILHTFVEISASEGIDFILIGGQAVNARGYERTTLDFDFLIAAKHLSHWAQVLERADYRLLTERISSFAQFAARKTGPLPVDLMLVDEGTFQRLLAGSEWRVVGGCQVRVASVLHLLALKLHSLSSPDRSKPDIDFLDIVNLIRLNSIDVRGTEFQELLARYGNESIKERILREL